MYTSVKDIFISKGFIAKFHTIDTHCLARGNQLDLKLDVYFVKGLKLNLALDGVGILLMNKSGEISV